MGRATSREDVLENLKQAEADGIVERDASAMMQRAMYVSDLKVRDVMIPKLNMEFVDIDDDLDRCLDVMVESGHSRFPVVDNDRDQIVKMMVGSE